MKSSKKLLEKKIALDNSRINGGLAMGSHATCSQYSYGDHCADKTTTVYNDRGQSIGDPSTSSWQT